jgi:hypothetical protein
MNRHAAHAHKAVEMIDLLTGYFDGGKRWMRGGWHDDRGRRCLISALFSLRRLHGLNGDPTRYYIREAILKRHRWRCDLNTYNERLVKTYDQLAPVLADARELALAAAKDYERTTIKRAA